MGNAFRYCVECDANVHLVSVWKTYKTARQASLELMGYLIIKQFMTQSVNVNGKLC